MAQYKHRARARKQREPDDRLCRTEDPRILEAIGALYEEYKGFAKSDEETAELLKRELGQGASLTAELYEMREGR